MYANIRHISVESGDAVDFAMALERELVPRLLRQAELESCTVIHTGGGTVLVVSTFPTWDHLTHGRSVTSDWLRTCRMSFAPRTQETWSGKTLLDVNAPSIV